MPITQLILISFVPGHECLHIFARKIISVSYHYHNKALHFPGYQSNENMYACSFWSQFLALIRPLLPMSHLIDMYYLLQVNFHLFLLAFVISVEIKIEDIQSSFRIFCDQFTVFQSLIKIWMISHKNEIFHTDWIDCYNCGRVKIHKILITTLDVIL